MCHQHPALSPTPSNTFSRSQKAHKMAREWTTPRPQSPRDLLHSLINASQRNTHQEPALWNNTYASVIIGHLSRNDLLRALDLAALKFSAVVSAELHRNITANLYCADGLAIGDVAPCWTFHQEWSWRFACLPHFVAVLRSGGNVGLFLGVRELVEGRRAVAVGLVKTGVVGGVTEEWSRY